jgi:hypothetical protein
VIGPFGPPLVINAHVETTFWGHLDSIAQVFYLPELGGVLRMSAPIQPSGTRSSKPWSHPLARQRGGNRRCGSSITIVCNLELRPTIEISRFGKKVMLIAAPTKNRAIRAMRSNQPS